MYTTTARKRVSPVTEAESEAQSRFSAKAVPNSAILPMAGVASGRPESSSDLGNRIRQRLPGVQERAQAQIATAEQEADRLSASVTSGSPEAVKVAMGRKLGADFSGVRFHTGANDMARAAAKGARAYTSGADIYFGEGGFDPSVAAHELVHTAQQGMVESAVSTVSTPTGGIQMEPAAQPRQKRKGMDRVAHTMERFEDKLTDKTVGRLSRWNKEAIDELHAAKTSGTWDKLSKKQKAAWIARNPIAYERYQNEAEVREKAAARVQKRAAQEAAVGAFLEQRWATDGKKRSFIGDAPAQQAGGAQGTTPTYHVRAINGKVNALGEASEATDEVLDQTGFVTDMADADAAGAGFGLVGNLKSGIEEGIEFVNAVREGRGGKALTHGANFIQNAESTYENIQTFVGDKMPGVPDGAGDALEGSMKALHGVNTAHKGNKQRRAMNAVNEKILNGRTREELSDDDVLKHDIAIQGRDQGKIMMVSGAGEAIEGTLQASAGVAELTGVGAVATPVLKAGAYAAKGATKVATHAMHDKLKGTVTEQATGINRDLIKEYLDSQNLEHNEKNIREAKRAMMRYMGFSSGYREELLADQSAKRAQKIVEGANAGDEIYLEMIRAMGGKADENGRYSVEGLRERLGSDKTRAEVAGSAHRIDAMAASNRTLRLNKEESLRQKVDRKQAEVDALMANGSPKSLRDRASLKIKKASLRRAQAALNRRVAKNQRFGYHP